MASETSNIKETLDTLFDLLTLKLDYDINTDDEGVSVNITTPDVSGLLIGSRGDTLRALQYIVSITLKNQTGEWQRVLLNVSDWREKEKERLTQLAETTASRVIETGEDVPLFNLTPDQRRIIHLIFKEREDVESVSEGEGSERHLIVKKS